MIRYKKTVLDNGVTVVTEESPDSRAVACGVWVRSGTRHEKKEEMGISHFLEHMVFKGTRNRSPFQLARALEAVGGELNAFTTREQTCFHTLSLPEHLELCLDVLSDLAVNATFPSSELELERRVILQEIAAAQENFEENLYDSFFERFFPGSLGFPILGRVDSIESLTRKQLRDRYLQRYSPKNIVISAAGHLDHQQVVDCIGKSIGRLKPTLRGSRKVGDRQGNKGFSGYLERESDQVHLLVGIPFPSMKDSFRFEGYIFNAFLGGGMTSRLYQTIREKRGLVYSIYSHVNAFSDTGLLTVYASTSEENFRKVLSLILSEMRKAVEKGFRASELKLFKTQVRGGILLGSDDVDSRMNSLAINEMIFGRYRGLDEVVDQVESVDMASMDEFFDRKVKLDRAGVFALGPGGQLNIQDWVEEVLHANFK